MNKWACLACERGLTEKKIYTPSVKLLLISHTLNYTSCYIGLDHGPHCSVWTNLPHVITVVTSAWLTFYSPFSLLNRATRWLWWWNGFPYCLPQFDLSLYLYVLLFYLLLSLTSHAVGIDDHLTLSSSLSLLLAHTQKIVVVFSSNADTMTLFTLIYKETIVMNLVSVYKKMNWIPFLWDWTTT